MAAPVEAAQAKQDFEYLGRRAERAMNEYADKVTAATDELRQEVAAMDSAAQSAGLPPVRCTVWRGHVVLDYSSGWLAGSAS